MAARSIGRGPGWRLKTGASVLSAARATDASVVKTRLARFERVHRGYADAQRKVDAAESQLRAAQARLEDCDAIQDKALGVLAGALITEGQPIRNAFGAFGAPSPRNLMELPFAEEAKAVHQLVAAVVREKKLGKATIQAAQAANKAARAVELALAAVVKIDRNAAQARQMRDVRGQAWEAVFVALRHEARGAARDGAPHLYDALFGPSRPVTKSKTAPVTAPPVTETPTAPTPPVTETSNAA